MAMQLPLLAPLPPLAPPHSTKNRAAWRRERQRPIKLWKNPLSSRQYHCMYAAVLVVTATAYLLLSKCISQWIRRGLNLLDICPSGSRASPRLFWTVCNACACKFTLNHANQVKFKVCRHRTYARIYYRLPTERAVCKYLMLMPIWFYPSQSRFIFTTFFMIWSLFLSRGLSKVVKTSTFMRPYIQLVFVL